MMKKGEDGKFVNFVVNATNGENPIETIKEQLSPYGLEVNAFMRLTENENASIWQCFLTGILGPPVSPVEETYLK